MEILDQLALALGFATLAGLNLYLTVFITGLAIRFNWVELATQYEQLSVLGSEAVLIASGIMLFAEFFSDKIPWVDSAWDAVHTAIRPIGGGLLAMQTLGDVDPAFDVIVALLFGTTTLVSHGFKSGTRLAINASPEPVSNIAASVTEDVVVLGGLGLMALSPELMAVLCLLFLGATLFYGPRLFRRIKAFFRLLWYKLGAWRREPEPSLYADLTSGDDLALRRAIDGGRPEVRWSTRCLVGAAKRWPGLSANVLGRLVIEGPEASPRAWFIGRKFWRRFHAAIPLDDMEIVVERRFLTEDVVLYRPDGRQKAVLRFHAGQRRFADKVAEELIRMRAGIEELDGDCETGAPIRTEKEGLRATSGPQGRELATGRLEAVS